jgi:hypothetical protein
MHALQLLKGYEQVLSRLGWTAFRAQLGDNLVLTGQMHETLADVPLNHLQVCFALRHARTIEPSLFAGKGQPDVPGHEDSTLRRQAC